jgi:lysozyme
MTPFLVDDLKRDEGLSLKAYPDSLTKGAPWTIGYGHTGPDVANDAVWTLDQVEAALEHDVANAVGVLDHVAAWWRQLNDARQDVLANMCFNMGWGDGKHGLSSFTHTLELIEAGNFLQAAENMRSSLWARQVKGRAARLAQQMETGERAPRQGDQVFPPAPAPQPSALPPTATTPLHKSKTVWGALVAGVIPLVAAIAPGAFQSHGYDAPSAQQATDALITLLATLSGNLALLGRANANIKPLG